MKQKAKDKRIKITLEIKAINKTLNSDENRYKQILINLISNAIKFTDEGGAIGVCVSQNSSQIEERKYSISVSDNGVGIPESDLNRLFSDFGKLETHQSINPEGVGLGLTISKALCE